MTIPTKKLKSGFEMPVFGLGTWQMGGAETRNPANDDQKDIAAIEEAIDLGINLIDTAESYADTYTEVLIGQTLKGFDRSKIFLTSKIRKINLHYDDVLSHCQASLKRLQTDYLDLYLIHFPNQEIPIEETLKAMDRLVTDGLVRNIGVSNFATPRLIEAQKHTQNRLVVNQVYYNLRIRNPEKEGLLNYCQQNDVFLQAYRPLEKGSFLANSVAPVLSEMAKKYDKTPAQAALNWLISQENVITLSKMSTTKHLKDNLGAIGWQMEPEDIEKLRDGFPDQVKMDQRLALA